MSDPINWYQSQRSTVDLWFASFDPTLPAPWRSVMDESSGLVFYWNPETNVSQYEHPNPVPPPPPHPPPDHYQIPYEYKPTFPYSSCNYRPPDYLASYMHELPVASSYTSPIFLPHPAPPSVMYSDSIDVPQIPHSYATNPNFHDPQIYSPSSYEQNSWVFDSDNRLQFHDPHQVFHYELDLGPDSKVHTAPTAGNVFSMVRGVRHTSPKTSLKSIRAKHKLAVVSHVRMKRTALSVSFCQIRQQNPVFPSFSATPSLPLVHLAQAQEQPSPTNTSAHTPIAIRKGTDKHMLIALQQRLDAETVTMGDPGPPGQELLHKRKTMTESGHKWARRVQGCKPIFQVRQQRVKWKFFDKGRSFRQSEKDIHNSDVPAEQGYHQFQSDSITMVGDQSWIPLRNLQSNAIQVFEELPKRSIKVRMLNFLIFDFMEQFKSGLAINEYIRCVLKALRVLRMLSFPFDEGGVLRELKLIGAMFNRIWQLTEVGIDIYYGLHDARYIGQVYFVQVIAYKVLAVATLVALVTVKDVVQTGDFVSADRLSSHPRSIYSGWSLYIKSNLMVVDSHYQAIVHVTGLSICRSFAIFDKHACFVAPTSCINVAPYIALFFIDGFANWSNISDNLWLTVGLRLVLVTATDTRLVCHISIYKSMVVAAAKKLGHYYDITLSSNSSLFKIVMHKFTQDPEWHACGHELNLGFITGGNLYAKCGLTLIVLVSLLISTRVLRISCALFDISQESGKWRVAFEIMVTLLEDQVRCSLLCKKIIHDDRPISFVLSHNEEVMPLLPTSFLGFSMDFMSMILWCGMRSLAIINDAHNFFMVNSHLDHAKLLKALIGIKLLDENWQDKSEATLRNTTATGKVFLLNACRILTLPHVNQTLSTASWDWVMKLCIRDDFVIVPLSHDWKYAVLESSSWSKECAVDRQKSVVVQSLCFGASSSLQILLHHAHKITADKFPKVVIDFELSSSKIHVELLTNGAIVYQGSTETERMKNYLFHFFTSAIEHNESAIWFFTDDILAFLILNSVSACARKVLLIATWIWTPRVFVWRTVSKGSFVAVDFVRNHGTWRVTPDNMSMIYSIVVCIYHSSEIPIISRKRDYSDVHFLEWIHLGAKDAVNFTYILVVPSTVPHVLENYYNTNEPNRVWYAQRNLILNAFYILFQKYRNCLKGLVVSLQIEKLDKSWSHFLKSTKIQHSYKVLILKDYARRVGTLNGLMAYDFSCYVWASNLITGHDSQDFEVANRTGILMSLCRGETFHQTLQLSLVILHASWNAIALIDMFIQHTLSFAINNSICPSDEWVVDNATRPIVLLIKAVKINVPQLLSSISSNYLAQLHEFILAGSELMMLGFKTIQKLILEMCMVQFENWLLSFPNRSMLLSRFERLEDKPHLKRWGVVRTIWLGPISSPSAHTR